MSDKDNPLNRVNRIHYLLKNFLHARTSFERGKMQGYLNLFAVVITPPADNLKKAGILMGLAFKNPKTLRYRDFYGLK
jgi:hypothetical protein